MSASSTWSIFHQSGLQQPVVGQKRNVAVLWDQNREVYNSNKTFKIQDSDTFTPLPFGSMLELVSEARLETLPHSDIHSQDIMQEWTLDKPISLTAGSINTPELIYRRKNIVATEASTRTEALATPHIAKGTHLTGAGVQVHHVQEALKVSPPPPSPPTPVASVSLSSASSTPPPSPPVATADVSKTPPSIAIPPSPSTPISPPPPPPPPHSSSLDSKVAAFPLSPSQPSSPVPPPPPPLPPFSAPASALDPPPFPQPSSPFVPLVPPPPTAPPIPPLIPLPPSVPILPSIPLPPSVPIEPTPVQTMNHESSLLQQIRNGIKLRTPVPVTKQETKSDLEKQVERFLPFVKQQEQKLQDDEDWNIQPQMRPKIDTSVVENKENKQEKQREPVLKDRPTTQREQNLNDTRAEREKRISALEEANKLNWTVLQNNPDEIVQQIKKQDTEVLAKMTEWVSQFADEPTEEQLKVWDALQMRREEIENKKAKLIAEERRLQQDQEMAAKLRKRRNAVRQDDDFE